MTPYLTGTRDGERKRRRKKRGENTNTTHLAQTGRTLEGQGKRKADGRRAKNRPEEGGGRKRLTQPYKARAKPTSAREGPQPDQNTGARMR